MIHWRKEGEYIRNGLNITAISSRLGMSIGLILRIGNYKIDKRWRSWTDNLPMRFMKK